MNAKSRRKPTVPATGVDEGVLRAAFADGVVDFPAILVGDAVGDADDDGAGGAAATASVTRSAACWHVATFTASEAPSAAYDPVKKSVTPVSKTLLAITPPESARMQRTLPPTPTLVAEYTRNGTLLIHTLTGSTGGANGADVGDADFDA